jgi:NAD+ kinase
MRIAIHGRPFNDDAAIHIKELFTQLDIKKSEIVVYSPFLQTLKKKNLVDKKFNTYSNPEDLPEVDYLISVGGDGTLLESVTFVGRKPIPILGINTGRLGFLATTQRQDACEAVTALYNKDFKIEERTLIKLISEKDVFQGVNFGLNEFTILKRDSSSMIVIHTYINGEYLNSYWADGLIVATPTGSTGYSLSCGGPLVLPQNKNFIISPVSPHNLNVRPMIVPDTCELSFQIEGRSKKIMISLDSRSRSISSGIELKVKKEDFSMKLIELKSYNYLQTLRNKLNWGLDLRN